MQEENFKKLMPRVKVMFYSFYLKEQFPMSDIHFSLTKGKPCTLLTVLTTKRHQQTKTWRMIKTAVGRKEKTKISKTLHWIWKYIVLEPIEKEAYWLKCPVILDKK